MFVLKKKRKFNGEGKPSEVVRVRLSTLEYVDEMAEESGLSRQEIMDRAVKYAYENLEWENEEI